MVKQHIFITRLRDKRVRKYKRKAEIYRQREERQKYTDEERKDRKIQEETD